MDNTFEHPEIIQQLRAERQGLTYRPAKRNAAPTPPDPDDLHALFTVESGNRWMELGERQPRAQMLFGEFWYEGELCILFADTNVGKSVLAVQIAESIARGLPIAPFGGGAKAAKVLYVDFELTTTQFYRRYSKPDAKGKGGAGDYEFSPNFMRAQFNPAAALPGNGATSDDGLLLAAIAYKLEQVKATVLIIDNLTCLRGGTENTQVALRLLKNLKTLQTAGGLSVLALAHTPKRRSTGQPLQAMHLQGSKLLLNFADSAFAIGSSCQRAGLRYLKQIKQRNTHQVYGEDNVCLCRILRHPSLRQAQDDSQPSTGSSSTGHPSTGHPSTGHPSAGLPSTSLPSTGHPSTGHPSTGSGLHMTETGNFLHFQFEGNAAEALHLPKRATAMATNRPELAQQVAELQSGGLNQRQIARQLNIALGTVNKLLKC